jgi:hypothetical protein
VTVDNFQFQAYLVVDASRNVIVTMRGEWAMFLYREAAEDFIVKNAALHGECFVVSVLMSAIPVDVPALVG